MGSFSSPRRCPKRTAENDSLITSHHPSLLLPWTLAPSAVHSPRQGSLQALNTEGGPMMSHSSWEWKREGQLSRWLGPGIGCRGVRGIHLPFLAFWHTLESEAENLMWKGSLPSWNDSQSSGGLTCCIHHSSPLWSWVQSWGCCDYVHLLGGLWVLTQCVRFLVLWALMSLTTRLPYWPQ